MVSVVVCLIAVVVSGAISSEAMKLPPYITPCVTSDPKFEECAIKNGNSALATVAKGDRKYHFANLDPLYVEEMSVDTTDGPVGVKITLKDVKIYGVPEMKVLSFRLDKVKKNMYIRVVMPRTEVLCKYDISGKILILPVVGNGDGNFTLEMLELTTTIDFDLITKPNGKVYMTPHDTTPGFTVKKAYIKLDNLFNGDKLLGDQLNLVMNDNWEIIVKDIGTPVVNGIGMSVQQGFNYLLDKVPFDEMFLP